jgi:quercetin dioxygenase-like cupin family protein
MFNKYSRKGYSRPLDGIEQKTLVHGEKTLMAEFRLAKGSIVPRHSHPHEQAGYLVSGRVRFSADGGEKICNPGDSWCIPGNEEHGAEAMQDSVLVEVFSPVREEYLPE